MHTSSTMASVPVGGQGFVSANVVLEEMISGGSGGAAVVAGHGASPVAAGNSAAPVVLDPAADAEVAAPVAAGGAGRAMRWTNNSSGFVLRRMAAMVSDCSRPDKVFKDKYVNQVVKALKDWCGEIISTT